ncbi:MAG: UDP-N-acetylmuramoylalanine--D-glutamate ligase [Solirubrobacteraceae bacterium]|jgi:UDP-N-acetylmuramoylalanine-D-glutamate ligase|nr:UDP-N-acetylmuramoylalanine--D-glutamate ligase [Solirubrobacteraceae bacterium]
MWAMTGARVSLDPPIAASLPSSRPAIPHGRFLVAGLGRAGRAAAQALSQAVGPELVRAWDADTGSSMRRLRSDLEAEGIRTRLSPGLTKREVGWARTLVKSPGIPLHAPVIQRALAKGLEVMDELELGWRLTLAPMVAVTGTNGKSTVCGMADSILSAAGLRVRLAGNTQFGSCLSSLASEPLDWIVCEVSSFQLEGCVHMLPDIAVFTNLTPEHLGRHRTLAQYGAIKRRLFVNDGRAVARAIIDVDSPFGHDLAAKIEWCGGVVTRVGFSSAADYRVTSAAWDLRLAEIDLSTPADRISLVSSLPGAYNARNVAAALAIADLIGVERRTSVAALRTYVGPSGRFEHIDEGQPFDVIVDFAHTPDALEQLLTTVRAGMKRAARLTVVFGVGGPPGTSMMNLGRVARESADRLILTTSGFRGSPPVLALESILAGARLATGGEMEVILDRRRAIERAVLSARAGDVIVIPGRGALPDMQPDPRGTPIPFDDRAVAREIVRDRAT